MWNHPADLGGPPAIQRQVVPQGRQHRPFHLKMEGHPTCLVMATAKREISIEADKYHLEGRRNDWIEFQG